MATESSGLGSISRAIVDLKAQNDRGAEKIWRRFFEQLCAYADQRIAPRYRRHFDEHDVANSAFYVLFDGIKKGRFAKLNNREELWQLLTVIAARKACNARKHHDRQKRGGGKVLGGGALSAGIREQLSGFLNCAEPTSPCQQVEQTSQDLLKILPDDSLRRIALWRLAGYSNAEIAEKLGCVTRTVERKLSLIRMLWARELDS